MQLIELTQGKFAQVDDHWFEELGQYNWFAQYDDKNGNFYACRSMPIGNGKFKVVRMHRQIMNTPDDQEVDHRDHNGLNNLEENMRNCTHRQNMSNYPAFGKSKYLGVSFLSSGKIRARIKVNGKSMFIGYFPTEEKAAIAYDEKAKEHHGEFANLNFKY
jgi:hypothetical protein